MDFARQGDLSLHELRLRLQKLTGLDLTVRKADIKRMAEIFGRRELHFANFRENNVAEALGMEGFLIRPVRPLLASIAFRLPGLNRHVVVSSFCSSFRGVNARLTMRTSSLRVFEQRAWTGLECGIQGLWDPAGVANGRVENFRHCPLTQHKG